MEDQEGLISRIRRGSSKSPKRDDAENSGMFSAKKSES